MTVENQEIIIKSNSILAKFLCKYAGYFDGELYQFSPNNGGLNLVKAKADFKAKFVIVSADFYKEKQLCFPLDNRKELNKLLKLQLSKQEIAVIQKQGDNQSQVNSWQFNSTISELFPEALIILPETLLIAQSCDNGDIVTVVNKKNQETFVTAFDGLVHSAKCFGLINNAKNFAMSAGIAVQKQVTLPYQDKANRLAANLSKLAINKTLAFVRKPEPKNIKVIALQLIAPSLAIISLYLILTSAYLFTKSTWLESELTQQSDEVTELLSLQSQLDDQFEYYQQLVLFWQDKQNTAGLWQIIAPTFKLSTIRTVQLKEKRFFIRGRTPNASELLETIAQNPNVAHTKFEAPVRKDRNQDSFYLSIQLKDTLFLHKEVEETTSE